MNPDSPINKRLWKDGFLTLGNIRDTALISLLIILTWKLLSSNILIKLESFSFTDLLSVLLAFFAIALSAAFYFKATDNSNMFYDNTYKFTKEVSEILGRIEAGFGERLRHIDEGYSGLRDKFDKMPFDLKAAKEEELKEEKHIEEQENERNKIILDLMEKARVADGEKENLLMKLQEYTNELETSKAELRRLKRNITSAEDKTQDVFSSFIQYLAKKLKPFVSEKYRNAPTSVLIRKFREIISKELLDSHDLEYMEVHDFTERGELTRSGAAIFRRAIAEAYSEL